MSARNREAVLEWIAIAAMIIIPYLLFGCHAQTRPLAPGEVACSKDEDCPLTGGPWRCGFAHVDSRPTCIFDDAPDDGPPEIGKRRK